MSSVVINKAFGTDLTNDQMVSQTSAQLSEREKSQIIERLIGILSENKLKPWVHSGLRDEYQKRFNHKLPEDWITIVEEVGRDVIEIETIPASNGARTLIQLPIRSVKRTPLDAPIRSPVSRVPQMASTPVKAEATPPPLTTIREPTEPMVVCTPKPEPGLKPIDNSSEELLIDIKPIEQKVVPKESETRQQSNAGAGDETKSDTEFDAVKGRPLVSNGVNHCNVYSNGAVDDVISGGIAIPPPVLPPPKPMPIEAEDFFDVVVLLAATPNNFIVVPFKNASEDSEFYKLKKEMYEFYEKEENKDDIPPELIKKGLFVAAKANNMWYRVEVMSVLSQNPFQVIGYLCDYGEHKTFSLENIQPLYNCFRYLPMQAIRASLATVEPVGNDWDVITSVEFRKMVENKPFVATIYAIKIVDNNPVLQVSLCDTTGADDEYVGPKLIQRNLAKPLVTSI